MNKGLKEKFKELGILIVYFFGSKAVGKGSLLSDIDIGIVLKTPPLNMDTRALYNRLLGIFSELYPDSKVDIVFLPTAPIALQFSAIKGGKVLWEDDGRLPADYENLVIQQYLDFRPVLDIFDRTAEERYAKA